MSRATLCNGDEDEDELVEADSGRTKHTERSCVENMKARWTSISVFESMVLMAFLASATAASSYDFLTSNDGVSRESFRYNMSYRLESSTVVRNARALVSCKHGKLRRE